MPGRECRAVIGLYVGEKVSETKRIAQYLYPASLDHFSVQISMPVDMQTFGKDFLLIPGAPLPSLSLKPRPIYEAIRPFSFAHRTHDTFMSIPHYISQCVASIAPVCTKVCVRRNRGFTVLHNCLIFHRGQITLRVGRSFLAN